MKGDCFLSLVLTLAVQTLAEGDLPTPAKCGAGSFYDVSSKRCVTCSSCPLDQIVKKLCGSENDVLCGDFTEFQEFKNSENTVHVNITLNVYEKHNSNTVTPKNSWRELSLALSIVISIVIIIIAGIIFYCWRKRRNSNKELSSVVYQRGSQGDPLEVIPEDQDRYVFL